jgi:hypothetical protein
MKNTKTYLHSINKKKCARKLREMCKILHSEMCIERSLKSQNLRFRR